MAAAFVIPAGAGALYFLVLFACGFVLGTLRTLVLMPAFGPVTAVALELPVMLVLSWVVAGRLTRGRAALAGARPRLTMGASALALLLAAECLLAVTLFGQSPAGWLAAMATPHGALGLAGQLAFGLIPWLRLLAGPTGRG
ncbi:hypothetical protein [Antarcticimicrobium luteum]|uniref:Uncharacterized protein n=1 Tax=Antarcticimicrobium luteum TaxID=2547397 RepID=A0A4R5UT63_9RHOB|nr:hypothetical protein [Antarcticimicrobium luteum]TDK42344.1 hypothetical protein E1832_19610 [Antarcticimicrobium luteum]